MEMEQTVKCHNKFSHIVLVGFYLNEDILNEQDEKKKKELIDNYVKNKATAGRAQLFDLAREKDFVADIKISDNYKYCMRIKTGHFGITVNLSDFGKDIKLVPKEESVEAEV